MSKYQQKSQGRVLYLDIETGPLPEVEAAVFAPEFSAPRNIKDPAKVAEAIEAKKQAWREDAALDPKRAEVLVTGTLAECLTVFYADDEEKVIETSLRQVEDYLCSGGIVVGHNILSFDMPFLLRRAWHYGLHVSGVFRHGRYWHDGLVDTMELWRLGTAPDQGRISLDHLARHLGVGQKTGSGKDFAQLWASDRQAALAYLENDLRLTQACYERMTS